MTTDRLAAPCSECGTMTVWTPDENGRGEWVAQPAPDLRALVAAADAVCQAWIADEAGEETFDPNLIDALGDALYGKPEGTEA